MKTAIIIRYCEIHLKGKNRGFFEKLLRENIKKSLNVLLESGIDFECRTTCDPRILEIDDIREIIYFLKEQGVKKYFLQKYRPIEGDKTQDSECEKFFNDTSLTNELKNSFSEFEIRK